MCTLVRAKRIAKSFGVKPDVHYSPLGNALYILLRRVEELEKQLIEARKQIDKLGGNHE